MLHAYGKTGTLLVLPIRLMSRFRYARARYALAR